MNDQGGGGRRGVAAGGQPDVAVAVYGVGRCKRVLVPHGAGRTGGDAANQHVDALKAWEVEVAGERIPHRSGGRVAGFPERLEFAVEPLAEQSGWEGHIEMAVVDQLPRGTGDETGLAVDLGHVPR